jgi:hypothetical protein
MFPTPPMPSFPQGQSITAAMPLRFEDVTQDGQLLPIALPAVLAPLWRDVVSPHAATRAAIATGIIPILTRMTLYAEDAPVRADHPGEVHAGFVVAHDGDSDAERKLYFNAWAELRAGAGKLSRGDEPGPRIRAGTLFAEHRFTRPLASPDQRRVARLDIPGYPDVPELRYPAPPPATAQEAPVGARWLDELSADSAEYCFTLDQTDSNQHVNSLVYIRMFLDAVHRRLAALGRPLRVRSRAIDIAYRKPSFAGDRARAQLRLFELGAPVDRAGELGAAGHIASSDGKIRCFVRALLAA